MPGRRLLLAALVIAFACGWHVLVAQGVREDDRAAIAAWYYRMVDMVADAMAHALVESRFGKLPASDSELNGDYLQVLARLGNTTGNQRFIDKRDNAPRFGTDRRRDARPWRLGRRALLRRSVMRS
jgi:hypothetical protein